ncbi:MAG: cellulase family glycosylhydrolase [Lachnospiraceae bacterium]|nr:cellulase family glycosylhydrolase [Lachnospiraceae bacterium]
MKKKNRKKFLTWILVFSLVLSILPVNGQVYAMAGNKIQLNAGKTKTMEAGTVFKLKVKNLPVKAKNIKYKWLSSKSSVVSVSKKGVVNARKEGTSKVTCTVKYSVKTGSKVVKKTNKLVCKIQVVPSAVPTKEPAPEAVPSPEVTPDASTVPEASAMPSLEASLPPSVTPAVTQVPEDTVPSDINNIIKDMGIGINLGNTMEAHWSDKNNKTTGAQTIGGNQPQDYEKCWGAVVTTKEVIDGYKAAGFSTVRIPVYWGNMMEDNGKFEINKEYMKRVQEIVKYCLDDGLYAVINIHHYDEFIIRNYPKEEALRITEKLWTQIAECFKDYSGYLVFEGFNENLGTQREGDNYTDDELYNYVNEMNQTFVNAVRGAGGNNLQRILIVSGWWTNIDKTTDARFKMPYDTADSRLMVSVHYIDNAMYWAEKTGSQEWLDYSRQQCELLKNAFTDKGIPVFVGECTSIYDVEHMADNAVYKESSKCLELIMDMAVNYGFVPVLWDVNDNFYSRTSYSVKSGSDQKVVAETAKKIKE